MSLRPWTGLAFSLSLPDQVLLGLVNPLLHGNRVGASSHCLCSPRPTTPVNQHTTSEPDKLVKRANQKPRHRHCCCVDGCPCPSQPCSAIHWTGASMAAATTDDTPSPKCLCNDSRQPSVRASCTELLDLIDLIDESKHAGTPRPALLLLLHGGAWWQWCYSGCCRILMSRPPPAGRSGSSPWPAHWLWWCRSPAESLVRPATCQSAGRAVVSHALMMTTSAQDRPLGRTVTALIMGCRQ